MLNNFREISKTLRRGLPLTLRTKVLYQAEPDAEIKVMFTSFPENLGLAFCSELTTSRVKGHGRGFLMTGVIEAAYNEIFCWMNACADGKRVVAFPYFKEHAFFKYACVAEAAKVLGIQELVVKMEQRLEGIAAKQVHTDDVYRIFTTECCAPYKEMVAKSIALAIHERRVKALNAVCRLRLAMPNINDDIKFEVEELRKNAGPAQIAA